MGSSENAATKKVSGSVKGFLILLLLVVAAWAVFKIITPGNFGSPRNMLSYFEASLMVATGAVGFYFVMVMGMFDFSIGANIMLYRCNRRNAERYLLCKASYPFHDRNNRSGTHL